MLMVGLCSDPCLSLNASLSVWLPFAMFRQLFENVGQSQASKSPDGGFRSPCVKLDKTPSDIWTRCHGQRGQRGGAQASVRKVGGPYSSDGGKRKLLFCSRQSFTLVKLSLTSSFVLAWLSNLSMKSLPDFRVEAHKQKEPCLLRFPASRLFVPNPARKRIEEQELMHRRRTR